MRHIPTILIILFLELNIYYCLGYVMGRVKWLPKTENFNRRLINGFLGYHFLFWCISFTCILFNATLNLLTILWVSVICVFMALILVKYWKDLIRSYVEVFLFFIKYKWFFVPCFALMAFIVYYISVNGSVDIDARTYIGEVTTMLDTNKLIGVQATTGSIMKYGEYLVVPFRRACAMFGANSAVLCHIFKIRPLIFCRTVRAAIDIILYVSVCYQVFSFIYEKSQNSVENTVMALMLAESALFLFNNTIYTHARFLLYRAYEGKAYCAGILVLTAISLAVLFCKTKDMRYFVLILIDMIASMSISASAAFIPPLAVGSIILAYSIMERKLKYVVALILSLSPNILYILLTIIGFSEIHIKG